jgi:DNA-binding NarL/FixJ family response regulator
MRALVIADSGPALADLTLALFELKNVELRHANGRTQVTRLARAFAPDLVVIDDMRWPRQAMARIAEVREAAPHAAIVVLTEELEGNWLADALRQGAAAVLPTTADAETLREVFADVLTRVPAAA